MDCHEPDQDEDEEDVRISESNNPMTLEQFTDIVLASEGMTTDSSDNTTDAASPANGKFTPSRFESFALLFCINYSVNCCALVHL